MRNELNVRKGGVMKKITLFVIFALITISTGGARDMKNGTKVKLIVGSTEIIATLNDSTSAQDLISKLPYTVRVNKSEVDFCGRLSTPLKNAQSEAQAGWKNGDISYIPGPEWIAFFYDGEVGSASYGKTQHIIGSVDNPSDLKKWPSGAIEVRIELF